MPPFATNSENAYESKAWKRGPIGSYEIKQLNESDLDYALDAIIIFNDEIISAKKDDY